MSMACASSIERSWVAELLALPITHLLEGAGVKVPIRCPVFIIAVLEIKLRSRIPRQTLITF